MHVHVKSCCRKLRHVRDLCASVSVPEIRIFPPLLSHGKSWNRYPAKFCLFAVRCSLTPPPLASLLENIPGASFRERGGLLWVLVAVRLKSSPAEMSSLPTRGRSSGAPLQGISTLVATWWCWGRGLFLDLCCVLAV